MPIVPHQDFRPNPERCIYVDGRFDETLLARVTPTILKLQAKSRRPITVYILSSPGGTITHMETLLHLLTMTNQDSAEPCRIITMVVKKAASAAADLLCAGDYAIADPDSTILYHGGRTYEDKPLTAQYTSVLATWLRLTSDKYAWELAARIERRFIFLFLTLRRQFPEIRKGRGRRNLTDFECYIEIVMSKLSSQAKEVCNRAKDRYKRYEAFLAALTPKAKPKKETQARLEGKRLKALIDRVVEENKKDPAWSFQFAGMVRLSEDFHILTEYLEGTQSARLKKWCQDYGIFSLTPEEKAEIDQIADESQRGEEILRRLRPILQPVWSFFVALCHALQEGENHLTALDAYWLGLIDEVVGNKDIYPLRLMFEYSEDKPQPKSAAGTEAAKKEGSEEPEARAIEQQQIPDAGPKA